MRVQAEVNLSVRRRIFRLEARQRGVAVVWTERIEPSVSERLLVIEPNQVAPVDIGVDQLDAREACDCGWYIVQCTAINRCKDRVA